MITICILAKRHIHKYYLLVVLIGIILSWVPFGLTWALALTVAPGALCWANVCILNIFGHRDINGTDSGILSFVTLGEGNHKYHHNSPTNANTGNDKFDISYQIIRLIERK
jgi:fatty-acid desaturase